jgi:hypothetical protein
MEKEWKNHLQDNIINYINKEYINVYIATINYFQVKLNSIRKQDMLHFINITKIM